MPDVHYEHNHYCSISHAWEPSREKVTRSCPSQTVKQYGSCSQPALGGCRGSHSPHGVWVPMQQGRPWGLGWHKAPGPAAWLVTQGSALDVLLTASPLQLASAYRSSCGVHHTYNREKSKGHYVPRHTSSGCMSPHQYLTYHLKCKCSKVFKSSYYTCMEGIYYMYTYEDILVESILYSVIYKIHFFFITHILCHVCTL